MSGNGNGNGARQRTALRAQLARADRLRDQIAKAWLVNVILDSPLSEVEQTPMGWASGELPEMISDILAAVSEPGEPRLPRQGLARAARLAQIRDGVPPAQLTREISALHTALLMTLREEIPEADPEVFAEVASRLSSVFGVVSGAAVEALLVRSAGAADQPTGVQRSAQMGPRLEQLISATRRYGHPFALVVLDIEGPGVRRGHSPEGPDSALSIVAAALRESVRLEDETFLLDEGGLCVLAPNQTSAEAGQMARRLSRMLSAVDAAGGLRISVSAGVVACPEHGDDPENLVRQADTAMWRSRSTGQAVTVAQFLQDR